MDFKQALKQAEMGLKVRRKTWPISSYIQLNKKVFNNQIISVLNDKTQSTVFTVEDIFADDWVFIEEKIPLSQNIISSNSLEYSIEVCDVKAFIKNVKDAIYKSHCSIGTIKKVLEKIDKLAGKELI